MTPAQLANIRLVVDSMEFNGLPDLGDEAMIHAEAAAWDMWKNHVPEILRVHWAWMSEESRLCVYLTTKAFTAYNYPKD
jgi:hypothetical protein